MKATVNAKNFTAELDNEAIKAIRFCTGFNTDLRVSLDAKNDSLWHFVDKFGVKIFGMNWLDVIRSAEDTEWDRYEKLVNNIVRQICR